ncbi:hypothetical protein BG005_003770, partial [Podila minutissima]
PGKNGHLIAAVVSVFDKVIKGRSMSTPVLRQQPQISRPYFDCHNIKLNGGVTLFPPPSPRNAATTCPMDLTDLKLTLDSKHLAATLLALHLGPYSSYCLHTCILRCPKFSLKVAPI